MNLLPKSHKDFKQQEYWNNFFKKRGKKAFEWYGEYPELCAHLHKYIKTKDDILVIGCGNSTLSMDLYDVGYRKLTNIDISKVAIRQMQDLNKIARPELRYIQMDAMDMKEFTDSTFSVVLDKGTLDALMPDDTQETRDSIKKLFNEIGRVLKIGGRYVCISLLQEHILKALVDYFPQNDWMFRVVRCLEVEQKTAENNQSNSGGGNGSMPVFAIIATKFKHLGQMVLEICIDGSDKMSRLTEIDEIIDAVKETQTTALICTRLAQTSIVGDPVKLDLYKPGENNPRFTIYVLDQIVNKPRRLKKYAVFIVPQGRESDWLFSTPEGRTNLLQSVEQDRLALVTMHRGQHYESWDSVKAELSENVKMLKPADGEEGIPFLSLGADVGYRLELHRGHSQISGDYVVEEIPQNQVSAESNNSNGTTDSVFALRRLIFLSNPFLVQSEALVKMVKIKNRTRCIVEITKLSCEHHIFMTLGVQMSLMNFQKSTKTTKETKEIKSASNNPKPDESNLKSSNNSIASDKSTNSSNESISNTKSNKTKTKLSKSNSPSNNSVTSNASISDNTTNTVSNKSSSNSKSKSNSSTNTKSNSNLAKCLVIGLGGGGLCTFLHHYFKNIELTAVEIDGEIVKIAENWFGLRQDYRFRIKIDDGLRFLRDAAQRGEKFDSILFDVDNKDPSVAIRCPPKEFIEKELLDIVNQCLSDRGIFILNLVCRDETVRKEVIQLLRSIFLTISSYKMEQDLNVIIFCTNIPEFNWKQQIQRATFAVNKLIVRNDSTTQSTDITRDVEMRDIMESLSIY